MGAFDTINCKMKEIVFYPYDKGYYQTKSLTENCGTYCEHFIIDAEGRLINRETKDLFEYTGRMIMYDYVYLDAEYRVIARHKRLKKYFVISIKFDVRFEKGVLDKQDIQDKSVMETKEEVGKIDIATSKRPLKPYARFVFEGAVCAGEEVKGSSYAEQDRKLVGKISKLKDEIGKLDQERRLLLDNERKKIVSYQEES